MQPSNQVGGMTAQKQVEIKKRRKNLQTSESRESYKIQRYDGGKNLRKKWSRMVKENRSHSVEC